MPPKTFITGAIVGFMALNYLLKSDKMTKEEQIEEFGMEVPEKFHGFLLGQNPPWNKERILKAMEIAEKYTNHEKEKDLME